MGREYSSRGRSSGRDRDSRGSPRGRDSGSRGSFRGSSGRGRDSGRDSGEYKEFDEKDYQRGPRSRGSRDQGRMNQRVRDSPRRSSRDSEYKDEFDVICAECHKKCKVPFKPSGLKPVLCSDCFRKVEKKGSTPDLQEIHKKLDKIMKALDINQ